MPWTVKFTADLSQDLPLPHEVRSEIPASLFGDALSLLEFLHIFSTHFESADQLPKGVNLGERVFANS